MTFCPGPPRGVVGEPRDSFLFARSHEECEANHLSDDDSNREDEREKLKRRLLKPYDETERREIARDRLRELFGDVVYSYTDDDAVADEVLKRFLTPQGRDTRHRITTNAYHDLTDHYRPSYPRYAEAEFMRFYFCELLPLVPFAFEADRHGRYLTTDFDFRVTDYAPGRSEQLWYVPNEIGGVTMMKPEDY